MVALSEWSLKGQVGQKRSTYDKTKIEDEKLLKQVITLYYALLSEGASVTNCVY